MKPKNSVLVLAALALVRIGLGAEVYSGVKGSDEGSRPAQNPSRQGMAKEVRDGSLGEVHGGPSCNEAKVQKSFNTLAVGKPLELEIGQTPDSVILRKCELSGDNYSLKTLAEHGTRYCELEMSSKPKNHRAIQLQNRLCALVAEEEYVLVELLMLSFRVGDLYLKYEPLIRSVLDSRFRNESQSYDYSFFNMVEAFNYSVMRESSNGTLLNIVFTGEFTRFLNEGFIQRLKAALSIDFMRIEKRIQDLEITYGDSVQPGIVSQEGLRVSKLKFSSSAIARPGIQTRKLIDSEGFKAEKMRVIAITEEKNLTEYIVSAFSNFTTGTLSHLDPSKTNPLTNNPNKTEDDPYFKNDVLRFILPEDLGIHKEALFSFFENFLFCGYQKGLSGLRYAFDENFPCVVYMLGFQDFEFVLTIDISGSYSYENRNIYTGILKFFKFLSKFPLSDEAIQAKIVIHPFPNFSDLPLNIMERMFSSFSSALQYTNKDRDRLYRYIRNVFAHLNHTNMHIFSVDSEHKNREDYGTVSDSIAKEVDEYIPQENDYRTG